MAAFFLSFVKEEEREERFKPKFDFFKPTSPC